MLMRRLAVSGFFHLMGMVLMSVPVLRSIVARHCSYAYPDSQKIDYLHIYSLLNFRVQSYRIIAATLLHYFLEHLSQMPLIV